MSGSAERGSVGFMNALERGSQSRTPSRGLTNRSGSQSHGRGADSHSPDSTTISPERQFPFNVKGNTEDYGYGVSSQTRSRTKDSTKHRSVAPSPQRHRFSSFFDFNAGASEGGVVSVAASSQYFSTTKNFPYLFWVLTWLTMWTFGGALVLFLVEEGRYSYFRCFFLAVASTTSGGLSTINVPALTSPSLTLLALLSLAGSSIMLTLLPVAVRMHHLQKSIPLDLRTFDLKNFKKLPLWVVEYKALQLVNRIVVAYCAFFYVAGTICLYLATVGYGSEAVVSTGGDGKGTDWSGHPGGFAIFTAIMAFTNTGLSFRPVFRSVPPLVLVIIDALVMAGNVFFPVLLRWIIILLNWVAPAQSNRKVYFRYLLLNGRSHYTHLFTSQQTWLLITMQFFFILLQSVFFSLLGTGVNNNQAVFVSINTRHAGFSSVDFSTQNAGILVFFLAMMSLAPTPFVVVLQRSGQESQMRPTTLGELQDTSIPVGAPLTPDYDNDSSTHDGLGLNLVAKSAARTGNDMQGAGSGGGSGSEINGPSSDGGEGSEVLGVIAETSAESPTGNVARGNNNIINDHEIHEDGRVFDGAATSRTTSSGSRKSLHLRARSAVGRMSEGFLNTSRRRMWRAPLSEADVNNRLASRALVMNLAAEQQELNGDNYDENDDPFMDTRLVLLKKFGGGRVPFKTKVGFRLYALRSSLMALGHELQSSAAVQEIFILWFAWFLIVTIEGWAILETRGDQSVLFSTIFEICSAYGNVGLSIGSQKKTNVSFSADLGVWSQCIILALMVFGKTREFPSAVDGSLEIASAEIVAEAFLKPGAVVRRNHRQGERHSAEEAYSEHVSQMASDHAVSTPGSSSSSDGTNVNLPNATGSSALPPVPPSLIAAAQEPPQPDVHVPTALPQANSSSPAV